MALAKGIFNMFQLHDIETAQLAHDQLNNVSIRYLNKNNALDFSVKPYLLIGMVIFMLTLSFMS